MSGGEGGGAALWPQARPRLHLPPAACAETRGVSAATEEPRAGSPAPVRPEVQPRSSAGGPAPRTFSRTHSLLLPASRLLPRDTRENTSGSEKSGPTETLAVPDVVEARRQAR